MKNADTFFFILCLPNKCNGSSPQKIVTENKGVTFKLHVIFETILSWNHLMVIKIMNFALFCTSQNGKQESDFILPPFGD